MSVRATEDQVVVQVSRDNEDVNRRIFFYGGPGRWATSYDLIAYPEVAMDRRSLTFLPDEPHHAPESSFLCPDVIPRSSWDELPSQYAAAFEIMRSGAPEYIRWVDNAVPFVIPLRAHGAQITSGSSKADPGSCHISSASNPIALAEMLIHEATHQYYHLLTRVAAVHDGTDKYLYYSPVKRRGRPVPYILLAYHAFANVLLFTRACVDAGIDDPNHYLGANEAELVPQLAQLDDALSRTTSLTTAGRALWRPLADRISGGPRW
jgi:HEXXH motif-containing protein